MQAGDISVNGFDTEDDTVDEENGSFSVKLLAATGATPRYTIGGGQAETADITINVEDNDAIPVIEMSQVTPGAITEGDEDVIEFSIFNDAENTTTSSTRDIVIRVGITEDEGDYIQS